MKKIKFSNLKIVKNAKMLVLNKGGTACTYLSMALTGITVGVTIYETVKAVRAVDDEQMSVNHDLSAVEKAKIVVPFYVLPLTLMMGTMGTSYLSNTINKKKQASLVGALSLVTGQFAEYQAKTREVVGKEKEQEIRDEIMKDYAKDIPEPEKDKCVFYFEPTNTYFWSTVSDVKGAMIDINKVYEKMGFASEGEFLRLTNATIKPKFDDSWDEIGWQFGDYGSEIHGYSHISFIRQVRTEVDDHGRNIEVKYIIADSTPERIKFEDYMNGKRRTGKYIPSYPGEEEDIIDGEW